MLIGISIRKNLRLYKPILNQGHFIVFYRFYTRFPIHHSTNHNTYSHDAYNYKGLKNMIRSSNSPLRIAIIAHSLYPIAQPYAGGLEMITQLICDELVAQGDIVHNHSLHHIPMMTGQAFGERFFTTFHTPIFPQLRLALLTLRSGTTTQFTAISKHQQQLFAEFVPSQVVYNGIDVESFIANTESLNNTNGSDDEVYFWYGRICPEKGTHLAMRYCMEAGKKLIIAGPKSNEDYFNQKVAPLLLQRQESSYLKKTKPPLSMVFLRLKTYHAKPAVTVLYSFVQYRPW